MPTATGHTTAIRASKVKGTTVYNTAGDKIGHVEDVILDKESDRIMFAAVGFGEAALECLVLFLQVDDELLELLRLGRLGGGQSGGDTASSACT